MGQFQRLFLVASPDMERTPAFERAVALAKASGATLHIGLFAFHETLEAIGQLDGEKMQQARDGFLASHEAWLAQEVATLQGSGLQVSSEVVWSKHPAEEILAHVQALKADLLIKDVHPEPTMQRAIATPLDLQLLHLCPVPVHLVSEARHALPEKVLAAVDPLVHAAKASELNDRIIGAAKALARQCHAELHLLDVSNAMGDQPFSTATLNLPWLGELEQKMKTASREAFNLLAKRHEVADDRHHFLLGAPVQRITDFAGSKGVDVLVMGASSREALGSTTEGVLYRLPCSVLIVHPQD